MNDSRAQQHKLKSTRQKQLAERPRTIPAQNTEHTPGPTHHSTRPGYKGPGVPTGIPPRPMSIGLQRQEGGGQAGHRQVAGPDWGCNPLYNHRHMLAGLVRPGQVSWGSGKQNRPTGAREQSASPALAWATGLSLATTGMWHSSTCAHVPCHIPSTSHYAHAPVLHVAYKAAR
jgi:hypothetical protein